MKIIVFLADGFEEVEALTVVDYLRRMDIQVDLVSITDDLQVMGAHKIEVRADRLIGDLDRESYSGLVLPGGLPGASNLRDSSQVIELVRDVHAREGLIGAICAGPIVLERAGLIEGRRLTSYPGFEEDLASADYIGKGVVVDGNIITGRGPAYAVDFSIALVNYLLGEDRAEELKEDILYSEKC